MSDTSDSLLAVTNAEFWRSWNLRFGVGSTAALAAYLCSATLNEPKRSTAARQ